MGGSHIVAQISKEHLLTLICHLDTIFWPYEKEVPFLDSRITNPRNGCSSLMAKFIISKRLKQNICKEFPSTQREKNSIRIFCTASSKRWGGTSTATFTACMQLLCTIPRNECSGCTAIPQAKNPYIFQTRKRDWCSAPRYKG